MHTKLKKKYNPQLSFLPNPKGSACGASRDGRSRGPGPGNPFFPDEGPGAPGSQGLAAAPRACDTWSLAPAPEASGPPVTHPPGARNLPDSLCHRDVTRRMRPQMETGYVHSKEGRSAHPRAVLTFTVPISGPVSALRSRKVGGETQRHENVARLQRGRTRTFPGRSCGQWRRQEDLRTHRALSRPSPGGVQDVPYRFMTSLTPKSYLPPEQERLLAG